MNNDKLTPDGIFSITHVLFEIYDKEHAASAPDIRVCPDCKQGILNKSGVCLRLCGYDEQELKEERDMEKY